MILLLFLAMFNKAFSLSLDEAISLYKNNGTKISELQKEIYLKNYEEYKRYNMINFGLQDSGTSYVNRRTQDTHEFIEHRVRNTLTPSLNLFGINFYTTWTSDWVIESKEFENRFVNFGGRVNLTDILYYSSSYYAIDSSYLNMKKSELSLAAKERGEIANLIDLYVAIKTYEGRLDIKNRSLEQLKKDKTFIEDKEKAGLSSKIDVDSICLQVSKTEQDIRALHRSIHSLKLQLCNKIGIEFNDQEFIDFDSEDIEDVLVDDSNIKVLEHQLNIDEKNEKIQFRRLLPDLSVNAEYDWNEALERYDGIYGISVSWDVIPNFAEHSNSSKSLEITKIELEDAKKNLELELENKRDDFLTNKEALKTAKSEKEYWERVVDIKREMYSNNLISLQEYMKYYNLLRDKEVEVTEKEYNLSAFKKKINLLKEMKVN